MIRIASQTGSHNYMYYTGLGKALMACMTFQEAKEVWEGSEIQSFTPNTITTFDKMVTELELHEKEDILLITKNMNLGSAVSQM